MAPFFAWSFAWGEFAWGCEPGVYEFSPGKRPARILATSKVVSSLNDFDVESVLDGTSVSRMDKNKRRSRCKYPGPVFSYMLIGSLVVNHGLLNLQCKFRSPWVNGPALLVKVLENLQEYSDFSKGQYSTPHPLKGLARPFETFLRDLQKCMWKIQMDSQHSVGFTGDSWGFLEIVEIHRRFLGIPGNC